MYHTERSFTVKLMHANPHPALGLHKLSLTSYNGVEFTFSTADQIVDMGTLQRPLTIRDLADLTVYVRFTSRTPNFIVYGLELTYLL